MYRPPSRLTELADRLDSLLVEGMSYYRQGYNVDAYWGLARVTLAAIWREFPKYAPVFESRVQQAFADVLAISAERSCWSQDLIESIPTPTIHGG